jgi:hypothetical protein
LGFRGVPSGPDVVRNADQISSSINISLSYYPSSDRSAGALAKKWAYAIMRDAATNTFREFWPDIATHVLRQHPAAK